MKEINIEIEGKHHRIEYESSLGDSFEIMHDWVQTHFNADELAIYNSEGFSPEKRALFDRWVADQQITSIKYYIDNVLQTSD